MLADAFIKSLWMVACRASTPLISVQSSVASNVNLPMNSSPTKSGY